MRLPDNELDEHDHHDPQERQGDEHRSPPGGADDDGARTGATTGAAPDTAAICE